MLSLDSGEYMIPRRVVVDGQHRGWYLFAVSGGMATRIVKAFNYTILPETSIGNRVVTERLSFTYTEDGNIKPTPRTLRIVGAEQLSPLIRYLYGQRVMQPSAKREGSSSDNSAEARARKMNESLGVYVRNSDS